MNAAEPTEPRKQRLAVFASHSGTTLQAVMDACSKARLHADVSLVISNNSRCGAMLRATDAGIKTMHISAKTHPDESCRDATITRSLQHAKIDWVLLLGYMKKLGNDTLRTYQNRIINTHPALLPKFGGRGYFGRRVHEAVVASAETHSGATIHMVDGEYDHGRILAQADLQIDAGETAESLEARVKPLEQALLIKTLNELLNDSATIT